jgi:RNA polymerase sigma-70 factor (ECF subfamily)
MPDDTDVFESHRPDLLALAYRMLGEMARAEDVVQEAWVRWRKRTAQVESPRAFLVTVVARLCLDELGSARARLEESRSDRLPEPVDLHDVGMARVETIDRVSMAFLVVLQRLTPAERAVLLLHDVFDMTHGEIGKVLGKNDAACRQLLKSARDQVASGRRTFETSREEHRRLLTAFIAAVSNHDPNALLDVLAEDAMLIADPGAGSRSFGKLREIGRPVLGRRKIAALIKVYSEQDPSSRVRYVERTLNGQPAVVAFLDGRALSALLIAVAEGKVQQIYLQGDPARLQHIGPPN